MLTKYFITFTASFLLTSDLLAGLGVDDSKRIIENRISMINEVFGSEISVNYKDLSDGSGGFSAEGFVHEEGGFGIINVSPRHLEKFSREMPDIWDEGLLAFIIGHESGHILFGHLEENFWDTFGEDTPVKQEILTQRIRQDVDQFAAKMMSVWNLPISSVKEFNNRLNRDPSYLNPISEQSNTEGVEKWMFWNRMGPICGNIVANFFEEHGASQSLVQQLRSNFCEQIKKKSKNFQPKIIPSLNCFSKK